MSTELRAPASQRVKITVPDAYKRTNEEVWDELEKYLYTGFVFSPATMAGHHFVFKSLNHTEIRNIEFMRPRSSMAEVRSVFRTHFIAHSVFMVDGSNVLFERPRHIMKLVRVISRFAPAVQDKIMENLAALNSRAHGLYPLVEVYVHENRSRYKWLQVQSIPVHSPLVTGVPGTDELGMNYAQQTWTALNRVQDKREVMEREWSNAKFIGSCMSKGVRAIDEKDRGRLEKERTDIEDLKMKVLYNYLNRTTGEAEAPQKVQLPDGRMAEVVKKFQVDSVEDLADQLSAALSGEKDSHDLAIEAKIASMKIRAREIETQQRRIYTSASMVPVESQEVGGGSSSRVLGGRREAEAYMARLQALRLQQMATAQGRVPALEDGQENSDEAKDSDGREGR